MPIEENNRNCLECQCDSNQEDTVDCALKCELLEEIRCCEFAINDLVLFLDTHPEDKRALCLHRNHCNHLRELQNRYQRMFGPLTNKCPCNKWRWLESPWPWEGSDC